MKPEDLVPVKDRLIAALSDNPVQRSINKLRGTDETPAEEHLTQLSPTGRRDYLTLVARTIIADGHVEADELTRLYCLFALLETTPTERLHLLEKLVFEPKQLESFPIPEEIIGHDQFRFALAKDALFVGQLQRDDATQQSVAQLLGEIALTPEQTAVMFDWVAMENTLLGKLGAGEEWMAPQNSVKEFTARAAAVGLPLTALYSAGIAGFSAVGISSGLATIGAATGLTVLGLNPMTAGIAGLIIAGITIKKLADYSLAGATAKAAAQRKEVAELVNLQVSAAAGLARDIPVFASERGLLRRSRRKTMVPVMQSALVAMLERAAGITEQVGA